MICVKTSFLTSKKSCTTCRGGGNLGNARKKSIFFLWGVPWDSYVKFPTTKKTNKCNNWQIALVLTILESAFILLPAIDNSQSVQDESIFMWPSLSPQFQPMGAQPQLRSSAPDSAAGRCSALPAKSLRCNRRCSQVSAPPEQGSKKSLNHYSYFDGKYQKFEMVRFQGKGQLFHFKLASALQ